MYMSGIFQQKNHFAIFLNCALQETSRGSFSPIHMFLFIFSLDLIIKLSEFIFKYVVERHNASA